MESIARFDGLRLLGLTKEKELQKRVNYLENKSREMEESIRYAGNLQRSILPNENTIRNVFSDAFVFYQPKDIVSGDFYWFYPYGDDIYFAVGDCTGHGVPGSLVTIAGNTILRQLIRQDGLSDPGEIMSLLDEELTGLFNENLTEGQRRDGMDIVFCKFNISQGKGSFCGAGRPLILLRDDELIEFKKGSNAIGYEYDQIKRFETETFDIFSGDQFYLFSDGYTDQFGGENVKKFNRKRFRNLLISMKDMDMKKQQKELDLTYNNWMGKQEQIDDVCVLGVKI